MLKTFIERPVLSTVISIIILMLGFISISSLPIEQYPDIAPPTVQVSASYPGASAETVLESVIIPIEEQINGVEGMTYITSTAANNGTASITVYFDQDVDALKNAIADERFTLINENFRFIKRFLRFHGIKQVDGILADLGVSSHQFDVAERGFSTRFDAELDMRMNQESALSAYEVINTYSEEDLKTIFFQYGELRQAPAMARVIVEERKQDGIKTSEQLKTVLNRFLNHKKRAVM